MKGFFLGIILLIVGGVSVLSLSVKNSNNVVNVSNISEIKSFYFTYTKGYAKDAYIIYRIDKRDGKYSAEIKPYGKSEEETKKVEISNESVKKLEDILNKYKVYSWNGFHKTNKNVLDGDSFSCSISTGNGDSISASGYMNWPDNYRNVVSELDEFFDGLN